MKVGIGKSVYFSGAAYHYDGILHKTTHGIMLKRIFLNDKWILGFILLNAAVIFAQGFHAPDAHIWYLDTLDNLITVLFLCEAIIKLRHFGRTAYFSSAWNVFDFVLVLLALPALAAWIFQLDMYGLGFLLVFRILRVFKFFRFIRFIPQIDKIITGVARAAKASVVIILGFLVFNFIVSLISCFLFRNAAPEFFADPILSLYSTFKIFTVEGWYEIPDSIVDGGSPAFTFFTRLYFIVILFAGGIIGLSLVNSIFVDTMVSDNTEDLEQLVAELQTKIDLLIEKTNGQNPER